MLKTLRESSLGKTTLRLVQTNAGYSGVAFGKVQCRLDGADADDVWRQLHDKVAEFHPDFFGFAGARNRFLQFFPNGFTGADYMNAERTYKVKAKAKLDTTVPVEEAVGGVGFGEPVLAVFRMTNLLAPIEQARMKEVLRGKLADRFVQGAAKFALGELIRGLADMEAALKPHNVAHWTAITYLPFLWKPGSHMFLKPEVTKSFAERVGHPFVHEYQTHLAESVYGSLLGLAAETERQIVDLQPRDRIDIQSLIWVAGAYTIADESPPSNR
jgi:hypothetical protein